MLFMLIFRKSALQIAVMGSFGFDLDQKQMTLSRQFVTAYFQKQSVIQIFLNRRVVYRRKKWPLNRTKVLTYWNF